MPPGRPANRARVIFPVEFVVAVSPLLHEDRRRLMTPIKDLTPNLRRALAGLVGGAILTTIGIASLVRGKVGYRTRRNGERVTTTISRESRPIEFWVPTFLVSGCGVYLISFGFADCRYLWRMRRRRKAEESAVE
jgi:hypothetical protein